MPVVTHVSVEEYLSTTYRPDCDYVSPEGMHEAKDGVLRTIKPDLTLPVGALFD